MAGESSERDLDAWLAPFLSAMGRKTRRTWAPLYLRGLLGPGDRKSLQPMAARLGLSGHDQLQHFIASPAWDDGPLWTELARTADRLVGGPDACLMIDDTALPKKGTRSVGVARQYCGALGKKANCQSLVSLTLARDEVPAPVGLRLFLPDDWTADPTRCARAGVPAAAITPQSKGAIALAELDRLRAEGLRFGVVLADAGYGCSAAFRHGLDARRLTWAVGIARNDYKRHGTTTLFAALDVLAGTVLGRCMQRHRHQEFIRFLNAVEAAVPAGKIVHAILDNYAVHKHLEVRAWLDRHRRWNFHLTPNSASWLNAVEGFFAKLAKRRLRRGVFGSLIEVQAAIKRFIAESNGEPKPFIWTADPDRIIQAAKRGHQVLDSHR